MSDWQNLQIEDICEYVVSGGTPLTSNKAYYQGGSIPCTGQAAQDTFI